MCTILTSTVNTDTNTVVTIENTRKGKFMITIDYTDRTPIYEQIVNSIEKLIALEILVADEKLPSVRSLGIELSTNPNTIQKAYTALESRGVVYSVKGIGNFVAHNDMKSKKLVEIKKEMEVLLSTAVTYGLEEVQLDKWIKELKEGIYDTGK